MTLTVVITSYLCCCRLGPGCATVDTISQAFTDSMTVSLTGIIFRNRLGEREEWEGQREDYSMVR